MFFFVLPLHLKAKRKRNDGEESGQPAKRPRETKRMEDGTYVQSVRDVHLDDYRNASEERYKDSFQSNKNKNKKKNIFNLLFFA